MERKLQKSLNNSRRSLRLLAFGLLSGYLILPAIIFILTSHPGFVSAEDNLVINEDSEELLIPEWMRSTDHPRSTDQIFGYNIIKVETVDGIFNLFTPYSSVEDILTDAGIQFDEDDKLNVSPNEILGSSAYIKLTKIDSNEESVEYPVPFSTIFEEDPELEVGNEILKQEGVDGKKVVVYEHIFADGVKVDQKIASETIIKDPTPEIIIKGTKPLPIILYTSNTCNYWDGIIDEKTADPNERLWLKSVMRCESGCNAANNGPHKGLFQFLPSTFERYGGENIFDGAEQIDITLRIYRLGGSGQWPYCSSRVTF